jgi:hypothetical protein
MYLISMIALCIVALFLRLYLSAIWRTAGTRRQPHAPSGAYPVFFGDGGSSSCGGSHVGDGGGCIGSGHSC